LAFSLLSRPYWAGVGRHLVLWWQSLPTCLINRSLSEPLPAAQAVAERPPLSPPVAPIPALLPQRVPARSVRMSSSTLRWRPGQGSSGVWVVKFTSSLPPLRNIAAPIVLNWSTPRTRVGWWSARSAIPCTTPIAGGSPARVRFRITILSPSLIPRQFNGGC